MEGSAVTEAEPQESPRAKGYQRIGRQPNIGDALILTAEFRRRGLRDLGQLWSAFALLGMLTSVPSADTELTELIDGILSGRITTKDVVAGRIVDRAESPARFARTINAWRSRGDEENEISTPAAHA